jgi:glutamate synthase domain-containing protein 1
MIGIAGVLSSQAHETLPEILKKIDHRGTSSTMSWEGYGLGETLSSLAATTVSDEEFETDRYLGSEDQLRSKEEFLYYRIFKQHFGDSVPLHEIGRTQHI